MAIISRTKEIEKLEQMSFALLLIMLNILYSIHLLTIQGGPHHWNG